MDTNNIKSLDRLPEWVTVTPAWVISCTRDALNHLGDWCKNNAGALAISVFATTGVNAALAWTPAQADTQSPSATLQATKGLEYWQMTNDGRDFAELTEAEVDGLSRTEKKAYYAWIDTKLINEEQRLATNREKVIKTSGLADKEGEKIIILDNEWKKLDQALIVEYKKALSNFIILYSSWKTDSDIFKWLKDSLLNILKTGEPDEVIAAIKKDPRIEKAIRA